MSMSEPFIPNLSERDDARAAAEPGPGAPGIPLTEEPDVLPADSEQDNDGADEVVPQNDLPFRTPERGERLTATELDDRARST